MGGEVTVYSGWLGAGLAGGMSGMALKLRPGMSKPGICIPLMGGIPPPIPPIMLDMSDDIMELLLLENEDELELENEEEDIEDMLLDMLPMLPIFISPILLIILLIISSIPRDFISPMPPIILGMPPMPPMLIIGGMGPPEDIMVEEEDEDDEDLKLEMVEPSSDCVVAAML